MNALIREIEASDEALLWKFLYLAIFVPPGQPPYPADIVRLPDIRRYVQDWGQPHDRGWIAWQESAPIGAAWLRLLSGTNRGFGYWNDQTPELCIAVIPGQRGRGIGSQLLTHLIEAAAPFYPAISLSVDAINPARRLYERCGFNPVGEKDGSVTMVRPSAAAESGTSGVQAEHKALP